MTGCSIPDTFDPMRRRREVAMTNYRDRERFFNEDDWPFEEDFDQDCQSTRQEMLILTSKTEVEHTNPRNCVVRTGEWLDEYTGKTLPWPSRSILTTSYPECTRIPTAATNGCLTRRSSFQTTPEPHAGREARNLAASGTEAPAATCPGTNFNANMLSCGK